MTSANHQGTVSIIGIGNMGSALAEASLAAGLTVTVWNRTVSKSQRIADLGAQLANSPAEAAHCSATTIVCVTDYEAFVSIIHNESMATALQGKRLIQLGVVTAEQARQTAAWMETRNIGYLEGSILGLPQNVRNASATLVCSGPESQFKCAQEMLSAFGNPKLVSEVIGNAYEFDKVYYSFAYATMLGFIQGAALAQASGFSTTAYTSIVLERIPVLSDNFKKFGEQITGRKHDGDQASLEVWADAYASSLELCRALNVDDTLPAALMHNFETAIGKGYGDKEITAIYETLLPESESSPG